MVGTGYVGLTTGACLASLGHQVICTDCDEAKVAALDRGIVGILEPRLEDLVTDGLAAGRLVFTTRTREAVTSADAVLLCLPTPTQPDGGADLDAVYRVVAEISPVLPAGCVLVVKSTVPVGTADELRSLVNRHDVSIVTNPEFLREGSAVSDFLNPDRIVIGCSDPEAGEWVSSLYCNPLVPIVITDQRTAEIAKYAANCFLAVKLSYINAVTRLCELVGASPASVAVIMGHDPRIGSAHLSPGPGWGGSCLPKDTRALLKTAEDAAFDFDVLRATVEFNRAHQAHLAGRIFTSASQARQGFPIRIGLLGLTFKAGTNDLRESPALAVARTLVELGAEVTAFDPTVLTDLPGIMTTADPNQVAKGAHCVAILTEWKEFRSLDWQVIAHLMDGDLVIDTRNLLDRNALHDAGLRLYGFGVWAERPCGLTDGVE